MVARIAKEASYDDYLEYESCIVDFDEYNLE